MRVAGFGLGTAFAYKIGDMKQQLGKWFTGLAVAIAGLGGVGSAGAGDITIYDGNSTSTTGWYGQQENNETEPGTITSQVWDLEKMLINGTQLTIQGGFNYTTGVTSGSKTYRRGDILIDLNGDAKTMWTSGNVADKTSNLYFGYDFAIHFSADGPLTYTIVDLNSSSTFEKVTDIQKSNPWRLADNSANDGVSDTFTAGFQELAADAEGKHYALTVDLSNYLPLLSAITAANEMLIKYTIECGNDTILGLASVPSLGLSAVTDGGTTLALFGLGLGGLTLVRSRMVKKPARS